MTALMPGALWKPVGNYTAVAIDHLGVVDHVTASETDPWSWFDEAGSQASSHLFVGNGQGGTADGQIDQYVDLLLKAWAEAAGNGSYISVETEGEPTEPLTQNQILSFARIMVEMNLMFGVPLVIVDVPGQRGLITHGDGGAAWGGHTGCPGPIRTAQRGQILYIAALELNPTPQPTGGPKMYQCEDPTTGGVWTIGADGHVEAEGGAPYLGGLQGNRWSWSAGGPISGFSARRDGKGQIGYDVAIALSKPNADGTWFNHYTFPRDASLKVVLNPEADLAALHASMPSPPSTDPIS